MPMLFRPGVKALFAGIHHSMVVESLKRTGEAMYNLSQKKQKSMAPIRKYVRKNNAPNKSTTGYKKQNMRSSIKNTVLAMSPAYHFTVGDTTNGSTLSTNEIYTYSITANIFQGTGNNQRQGDGIYLEALKLRGYVRSAIAANGYHFRILVGWSGEEYSVASLSTGQLTSTQIFQPNTGTFSLVDAIVNPKAFTVLSDTTIDLNSQIAGVADIQSLSTVIPLKTKFLYQSAGGVNGKDRNLYYVIIGTAPGAAAATTVGDTGVALDLIFKNM